MLLRLSLVVIARMLPSALVAVLLHLQHLQRFRVNLGFEAAPLGIYAAYFIATIVNLEALNLPALCSPHLTYRLACLPAI